jgi:hypothetical protein
MKFLTMVTTSNPEKAGAAPPALYQAIDELGMQAGKTLLDNGGLSVTGVVDPRSGCDGRPPYP